MALRIQGNVAQSCPRGDQSSGWERMNMNEHILSMRQWKSSVLQFLCVLFPFNSQWTSSEPVSSVTVDGMVQETLEFSG